MIDDVYLEIRPEELFSHLISYSLKQEHYFSKFSDEIQESFLLQNYNYAIAEFSDGKVRFILLQEDKKPRVFKRGCKHNFDVVNLNAKGTYKKYTCKLCGFTENIDSGD